MKKQETDQGAPAAQSKRGLCGICQHGQATAADWGQLLPDDLCWASVGSMSHAKADCYRWGYERLRDWIERSTAEHTSMNDHLYAKLDAAEPPNE